MILFQDCIFVGFAIYHFVVGAMSLLSVGQTRWIAKKLYSLDLPENLDPRYEYCLKPVGMYAICIGFFSTWGIWAAERDRQFFILVLALLLLMRAAARFFHRELFAKAFGTPWNRSQWNVYFNVALALLIFTSLLWK